MLQHITHPTLQYTGENISICDGYNYLGVHIDRALTFEQHLMEMQKILQLKCFKLGKDKKFLPPPTRICFYKQAILPCKTYRMKHYNIINVITYGEPETLTLMKFIQNVLIVL